MPHHVRARQVRRSAGIRGLRIREVDLLSAGLSRAEIVAELTGLELEDIKVALAFAVRRVDHSVIAA